ncbi:MAG: hypothetical protein IPL65_09770 [Lewinellaceae bacterium]|nr:hypothetical protein [Lewinellaceae bacterium]
MQERPLDDPGEFQPRRSSHLLTWWAIGLSMGMALLVVNLLDKSGFIPAVLVLDQDWVVFLLMMAIMAAGPIYLAVMLERSEADLSPRRSGILGFWSGVLGSSIFLFLRFVVDHLELETHLPTSLLIMLISGWFCGLVASAYTNFQRLRGWGVWWLMLLLWVGAVVLLLGSPWIQI